MKVIIYGQRENTLELENKVKLALDELWLGDFIALEVTDNDSLIANLNIQKEPALIVEEEAIDFKDTIFEGIIPTDEEIRSMFVSIIGGGDAGWGSCGSGWCGDCTGC